MVEDSGRQWRTVEDSGGQWRTVMHSERQWKTGDQLSLSHARGALTRGVGASQVLNKIDLPGADPERVLREIEEVIGLDVSNAVAARACPLLCRLPLLNPAASVFPTLLPAPPRSESTPCEGIVGLATR
jgi:hypothetical protein